MKQTVITAISRYVRLKDSERGRGNQWTGRTVQIVKQDISPFGFLYVALAYHGK